SSRAAVSRKPWLRWNAPILRTFQRTNRCKSAMESGPPLTAMRMRSCLATDMACRFSRKTVSRSKSTGLHPPIGLNFPLGGNEAGHHHHHIICHPAIGLGDAIGEDHFRQGGGIRFPSVQSPQLPAHPLILAAYLACGLKHTIG